MTPPGGFDPEETATRGRRRPELTSMLDAQEAFDDDTEGQGGSTEYALLEGDVIMAKITQATVTQLGDAWVTYGAQTRVMNGEDEGTAFNRLAAVTNTRVLDMIGEHEAQVAAEMQARLEEARNHRIPTQRG